MKLLKHKPLKPEELETLKERAINDGEQFVKWMLPFYSPKMGAALKAGWKASVGVSHIWLEGYAGLRVMLGGQTYSGERWLHISLSRATRLPSWGDIGKVKELFLGDDREAYQVYPIKERYINHHPYVLHLWSNFDKPCYLPDFRIKDPITGRLSI